MGFTVEDTHLIKCQQGLWSHTFVQDVSGHNGMLME